MPVYIKLFLSFVLHLVSLKEEANWTLEAVIHTYGSMYRNTRALSVSDVALIKVIKRRLHRIRFIVARTMYLHIAA